MLSIKVSCWPNIWVFLILFATLMLYIVSTSSMVPPMRFHAYSVLIQDIKVLLEQGNVMVNHTLREENQCADFFAKLRASSDVEFLRHESPLMNLKNLLQNDVAEIFLSVLALYNKKLAHIK